ncbi:MAG: gfo/Idh/MocA family oxidoreductase, partial [Alphaproteobacteria bacterium]|nr:gfo/Idh/MocA family oxidoreductase [Alphaproteobacteria bacterium]
MVRIGLVGLGGMGTVHYSNYQHITEARVVAATGTTDKDRENAKSWGIPIYETVSQMLEQEEVDVVDVCTPTFLHKEHVMAALNQGKPVICEKPLALNAG